MSLVVHALLGIVQYVFALPTSTSNTTTISLRSLGSSSCDNIHECRTIVSIIWSCLNTIFLCTWVTMHPNIPANNETGRWVAFAKRARLLAGMLLAPEYFVFDAFYEWREGCGLVTTLSAYGVRWTETHGMMAAMGGFQVVKDRHLLGPRLSYDMLDKLLEECEVDFAAITEGDIQDRSKGDAIAKALVLLQITWFVAQCLARFIQDLPVTLLELTTLGHTAFVAMIYFFWWNKPLNVRYPIVLHARIRTEPAACQIVSEADAGEEEDHPEMKGRDARHLVSCTPLVEKPTDPTPCGLSRRVRLASYIDGLTMRSIGGSIAMLLGIILVLVGSGAFGAIHCLGWNYPAPGGNQLLWQIAAIFVTATPPLGLAAMAMDQFLGGISVWMFRLILIPYGGSRISLLILACLALKSLPPAAYQTPSWTAFVPHL